MATFEKGQLYNIALSDLRTDPNQPRKYMDTTALEELTASIREHGVLVPIIFRQNTTDGVLNVVAGERRFAAAQTVGLTVIPAIFVDGNTSEIALVENLLRQDLTAVEEAEALQRLKEEQKYTDEQLSGVMGKARTTISDIILINRIPIDIRNECRGDRNISKNFLIEIARKKQDRTMQTAFGKYRVKQQKAAKSLTKKVRAPKSADDILQWLGMTDKKLGNINASNWTDGEKSAFTGALTGMEKTIRALLNPQPAESKQE